MTTISYTTVRQKLAQTMEKVCNDHEPIIITRQTAKPVVLISLEDYNSLNETSFLLRSPLNSLRLAEAIAEIEAGKAQEKTLIDIPDK